MKDNPKGPKSKAQPNDTQPKRTGIVSASTDDSASPELIKYRLLGAVVTFVLLALFGPEVLDGRGRVQTNALIELPDRPELPEPSILKPPSPKGTGFDEKALASAQQRLLVKQPETQTSSLDDPTTDVKPLPRKASQLAQDKPAWTLQLATFSQPKNAYALREKLTKAGFNTYSRLLKDASGQTKYQVFVGPELNKERLLAVKKQIAKKMKLNDGIIKPYRP